MYDRWLRMKNSGFTLLETLVVMAMTGILAASAFGGYSKHLHKKNEAQATKMVYEIAQDLEIHRASNFSYKGFSTASYVLPEGATGSKVKYNISVIDGSANAPAINSTNAIGRDYIIRAVSTTTAAHSFLYTSKGMRCKNKANNLVTNSGCGTAAQGSTSW